MKKLLTLTIIVLTMAFTTEATAQKFSGLDMSICDITYYKTDRNSPPLIKVVYSRPLKKGRDLFGSSSLGTYGKVWRTGANESTEIQLFSDMKFGNKSIKAGTYSLFTIPGEKEWTIILNSDLNTWGAYSYKEANDVARISVPATTADKDIDAFSIVFDDKGNMHIGWGTTRVAVPFTK